MRTSATPPSPRGTLSRPRQAVAHRLVRTAAQTSPGTASACQHVTSERKIPIVAEIAALRCRRHHRGDALRAGLRLNIHRSHVDNCLAPTWAQSLPDLLAAHRINGVWAGNWGRGRQGLQACPLASHRHPGILHSSSTSLVHSRLRSGPQGVPGAWRSLSSPASSRARSRLACAVLVTAMSWRALSRIRSASRSPSARGTGSRSASRRSAARSMTGTRGTKHRSPPTSGGGRARTVPSDTCLSVSR